MSAKDHLFTLGIEEEFQIIDPDARELRSHIHQILADGKMILKKRVNRKFINRRLELGTEICGDARVAQQQVVNIRSDLIRLAARDGLKIASAATHPFYIGRTSSDWFNQIRNYFWWERSSQGVEHRQHVDDFLADRSCNRSQISGGGENHAAQAQH